MIKKASKKIPTVILDIDDTIVDFVGFLCYLYNAKNETSITGSDLTSWDFVGTKVEDAQGKVVRGSELRKFFKDYEDSGLYAACPVIKESALAISFMKKLGYKIILMTARDEKHKKDTEINLLVNKIPYDELIFDREKDKRVRRLARKHSIYLFADDNLHHIKSVFETDRVDQCFLINRHHNKNLEAPEEVTRIDDLLEAVRTLPEVDNEF